MRTVKKIFTILIIIIVAAIATGIAMSYIYRDEAINLLKNELNKNIKTTVNVSSIDFSLLKKFPFAAVQFNNITALSEKSFMNNHDFTINTDTLFAFEKLFLEFNLVHLFNKNYKIKRLDARNGKLYLLKDKKGKENYHIWEKKKDTSEIKLILSDVKFKNVKIRYINKINDMNIAGFFPDIKLDGNFRRKKFDLAINITSKIKKFSLNKVQYLSNKPVNLNTTVKVIGDDYHIKKGIASIAGIPLNLTGHIKTGPPSQLNLKAYSSNFDIQSFINNLPVQYKKGFKKIRGQGQAYFAARISGVMHKNNMPGIYANFGIKKGKISNTRLNIPITNITLKGTFTNGNKHLAATSSIKFKKIEALFGKSNIKGTAEISNFKSPQMQFAGSGKISLKEIKDLSALDTLENLNGKIDYNLKLKCLLKEWNKLNADNVIDAGLKGTIKINEGSCKIKGVNLKAEHINGEISLKDKIIFNNLHFLTGHTNYLLNGHMDPVPPLFKKEKTEYHIKASLQGDNVDMKHYTRNKKSTEKSAKGILFPENFRVDMHFNLNTFIYGNFNATNIKGRLNYKPKMFTLKSVSLNAMNGSIVGGGVIIQKYNNEFLVRSQNELKNIDASNLFYAFNNFGQDVLKEEHLNGNINGTLDYRSDFNKNFRVKKPSINAMGNIKITQGELINFKPMMGLSNFIKVSELKHIKFSTLENTISIKNEKIIIPQMDIHSSAFNISGSGVHHFNKNYTYHVKILFSELLSRKMKKAKEENEKFGVVEDKKDGRTSLFLKIEGDENDYKVNYDKQKVKTKIKDQFEAEKKELKTILHEEFGLFNNDTTLEEKDEEQQPFDIEWEEEEDIKKEKKNNKETQNDKREKDEKEKKERFNIQWDDE